MESDNSTRLEIKTSADGRPLEFVVKASDPVLSLDDKRFYKADFTVDLPRLSHALQEAHEKFQGLIPIDWKAYYAEQQRIADDWRWQNDPLEIKQYLEFIWDDILCNASDLFYMLGSVCDDVGDRLYPYK